MNKIILFNDEARKKLQCGVDKLANAVKVTMGAMGRNVIIDKGYGNPVMTKDGVSVAKAIELTDEIENIGAQLIKQVASKTNDDTGDGTTTATVLAQAMITSGLEHLTNGHNPIEIKKGMDKAVSIVVEELKRVAIPVKDKEMRAQVASISANDKAIGELIAQAMEDVGADGVITVEDGNKVGFEVEVVKGMEFDRGYVSPHMVTNTGQMTAEYINPYILVTDKKITSINDLVPILEKVINAKSKDIIIIAEDFENEVLTTFIANKVRGIFNALAIKAPDIGEARKDKLNDIAFITGATLITDEIGLTFDLVELEQLGRASKVITSKDTTKIIEGRGDKEKIAERITQLKTVLELQTTAFDKDKLQKRIAKLVGGVAVIKVGASSDLEVKEIKDRIEDALNATKASTEEGIVAGGGVALIRTLPLFEGMNCETPSEKLGIEIIMQAIKVPLHQIALNAGKNASEVVKHVIGLEGNFGYDASKDTYEDMMEKGIIDPVKVTRSALQNACSIASMFLTTEVVIANEKSK
jgi:chaperonin GroEL